MNAYYEKTPGGRHMNRTDAWLIAIALTACSGIAAGAQPDETQQLQPVIVTAQRRAENIQSVPIQITALSGQQLASAGVRNTQQALNLIPNVNVAHSFTFLNSFVTIRGISEINNADPPMLVVVDGVAQNSQKQLLMDLFDVQQVQVLMGPQGGLYGQNAIGGAMIITTRQPTNRFHSRMDLTYGNGGAYGALGSLSGPIIRDKLLFRLDGNVRGSAGLITNPYLGKKVDAVNHDDTVAARLLAFPTSWLTLDLRGDYNGFKGGATWDSVVSSADPNDIEPPVSDYRGGTNGNVRDLAFKLDADLGFATLTAVTGYTNLWEDYRGSLDFTNPVMNPGGLFGFLGPVGQGQNLSTAMTSQEIHLVSPTARRLRWIVGAYYVKTTKSLLTRGFFEIPVGSDQFYNASDVIIDRDEADHDYSWALYGQADYDLTSKLTATAGFRYDYDNLAQTNEAAPGPGDLASRSESAPEPKATLTYHFTRRTLGYLTYSTGFRGGGFNSPGISAPYSEYFKPETLTNYEAGFKTSWLDRRLIVNGAYYYDVDHNYQFFFVNAANGSQIIQNLNRVHISGVELSAQAAVTRGLQVFGGLGTTHTDIIDSANVSAAFPGINGNRTPKTIPWNLKAGVQYSRPLGNDLVGTARVDYTHDGKEYWQVDNRAVQKPLDLVDARAGVEFDPWGIYVWGKNLTNERYYEDYNPGKFSGLPYDIGSLAEPRTYGLEVTAHF
jgi:iron complex outermembrane receptor protein